MIIERLSILVSFSVGLLYSAIEAIRPIIKATENLLNQSKGI